MPTGDTFIKALTAGITAVLITLIGLIATFIRNRINRRRAAHPRLESTYNKVTWAVLIIGGVIAAIAILYAYLTSTPYGQ
jgi:H+/gluconate symporter-like permease